MEMHGQLRLLLLEGRLRYLRGEIVRSLGEQAIAASPDERARHAADEETLRRMASRAEEALLSARCRAA